MDVFDGWSPASRAYALLVRQPMTSTGAIATALECTPDEAEQALVELSAAGFVVRLQRGGQQVWEAQSPQAVADGLLTAHEQQLTALRRQSNSLAQQFWLARRDSEHYPGIEVLRDHDLVIEQYLRAQAGARRRFRIFDRAPYFTDTDSRFVAEQTELQRARMSAGVEYFTIYEDSVFDHPEYGEVALSQIDKGERARTLPTLPMKLAISDDNWAILPLDPADIVDGAALVVRPSGLLTALATLFDVLWRLAVPLSGRRGEELGERDRQILTLMSSGATDDAIARRLGLSRRTVVRHTSTLLHRLGATNRFQAGVQAARQGWL